MASRKPEQILALDGLRAIAILSVMVFHFSCVFEHGTTRLDHLVVSLASHGSRGVDLFFVLSGFLITRILVRSRDSGNYLESFYVRRILRIFPVYFFYMLIVFGLMRTIHPWLFAQTRLWPYLAYVSNWQAGTGLADPHLSHIWSLAVEEQFYLVWPLLVLLCPPRRLLHVCTAVCVVALGLRIAATGHMAPAMVFRMTPFRADALAGGAILAVIFESEQRSALLKRFAAPVGAVVMLLAALLRGAAFAQAVEFSAIVVGCAAVVALAASLNPRVLCFPFLTAIGKYSYGMYVYHILLGSLIWSWLKAWNGIVPMAVLKWCYFPVAGAAVYAVAWASYRYFESPFLRLKDHFTVREAGAAPKQIPVEAPSTVLPAPAMVAYMTGAGAA